MSKTNKIILAVAAIVILCAIWYGASRKLTPLAKEPIKIGAIYGLTGPLASTGEQFREGLTFAVDTINKQGGINGREISLIIEDNQSDPKNAVSAFNKLVDIDKVKYLHSFGSAVDLALKPLAQEKQVLLFADAAHPKITDNSIFVLRHSNTASSDVKTLVEEVKKKNPQKVGIIHVNDDWGVVFNQEFQKALLEFNPNIEIVSEAHLPTDTDFRTQITKILSVNPDIVLTVSFGSSPGIAIKQLREAGYSGDIFANIGFILSFDGQKIAGDAAKGIYYQTFADNATYNNDFFAQYGKQPTGFFGKYVFLDIELLKQAIEKVGENPKDIADYIKGLGSFKGTYETVQILPSGDIIIPSEVKIWGE
ncbi:MAG: ABC transporter substrate-binding protein [Candidatus Pacebacteria bacterium]|nr:ABC transporter substrate-binding protein [Candidatus Paceibacterota bacterium]